MTPQEALAVLIKNGYTAYRNEDHEGPDNLLFNVTISKQNSKRVHSGFGSTFEMALTHAVDNCIQDIRDRREELILEVDRLEATLEEMGEALCV